MACWEAGPGLVALTGMLAFPQIAVGDRSLPETVAIQRVPEGSEPLTVTRITSTGDFVVVSNDCAGTVSLCTIAVAFAPTTAGARTGQLIIETDAATGSLLVPLEGTGATTPVRQLLPLSGAMNAGSARVGETAEAVFTFLNSGNSTGRVSLSSNSAEFVISQDECSTAAVPPYGYCSMTIRFSPSDAGTRVGALSASGDFENLPMTWAIQGEGVLPRIRLSASSATLDFGALFGGGTSVRQLSLLNDGDVPVTIGQVALLQPGAGFVLGSTAACIATLAPGESCDLRVDFSPVTYGLASGSVVVSSTAPRSPLTIELRGRLVRPETTVSASVSRLVVGRTLVGGTSAGKSVTLTNTGANLLYVEQPAAWEPFSVDLGTCTAPVDPGGQCTVMLHARSVSGGLFAFDARIPVNTADLYVPITLVGFGEPSTCP